MVAPRPPHEHVNQARGNEDKQNADEPPKPRKAALFLLVSTLFVARLTVIAWATLARTTITGTAITWPTLAWAAVASLLVITLLPVALLVLALLAVPLLTVTLLVLTLLPVALVLLRRWRDRPGNCGVFAGLVVVGAVWGRREHGGRVVLRRHALGVATLAVLRWWRRVVASRLLDPGVLRIAGALGVVAFRCAVLA